MNLWAKRTGQLLFIAVLFLMSCEDDTFLLGFPDEAKKFEVKFQEFNLGDGSSIISVDSTTTDNNTTFRRLLIGEDIDPVVGTTRAEAFAQFFSDGIKLAAKADHTYVYDSIVLSLQLDGYAHGISGNATGIYNVYRVSDDLAYSKDETYTMPGTDKEVLVKVPTNYFTNSTSQYSVDPLGQTKFQKLYTFQKKERRISTTITKTKLSSATDTLVAFTRLNDGFGQELFNVALNNTNNEFSDTEKFKAVFKGLAFIPEEGNAVLGFNPSGLYTRVRLYYHSELAGVKKDTLTKDFRFSGASFHSLNSIRNGEFPPTDDPYSGVSSGNLRIVQNGNRMITKIDLNNLYSQFIDMATDDNIIINAAEIVIGSVTSSEEYEPLPLLELRLMNETDDRYLNHRIIDQTYRDSLKNFFVFTDSRNYYVTSDFLQSQTALAVGLGYNNSKNTYSGSVTLFVQSLFKKRNSDYRPSYLALYPGTTMTGSTAGFPIGKTLNRSLFLKENIKLRVYYTQANKSNL